MSFQILSRQLRSQVQGQLRLWSTCTLSFKRATSFWASRKRTPHWVQSRDRKWSTLPTDSRSNEPPPPTRSKGQITRSPTTTFFHLSAIGSWKKKHSTATAWWLWMPPSRARPLTCSAGFTQPTSFKLEDTQPGVRLCLVTIGSSWVYNLWMLVARTCSSTHLQSLELMFYPERTLCLQTDSKSTGLHSKAPIMSALISTTTWKWRQGYSKSTSGQLVKRSITSRC